MTIPLSAPDVTESEIEAVAAVLRSPYLSLGPKLGEFEAAFTRLTGMPHAIAVSSGTAGLHLAIHALGIGPGDEVIVPSFTFIAVANVVRYQQATPVFADIDADSLNLSPEAVERAITSRTRAILAVHTFGRPAQMAALRSLARQHGLALIEDACEAIGGAIGDQPIGSFGDIAVFAFYPNKQITSGEGGMIVTPSPELAARMRSLRNQGRGPADGWFEHTEVGYNYRLSEINCALGIGQMARLTSILDRREAVARLYQEALAPLAALGRLVLPAIEAPGVTLSWFVYVVRLGSMYTAAHRSLVIAALKAQGIGCGRYFSPIHLQPAYCDSQPRASLTVTEEVACRTIALPFFNRLDKAQVIEVCQALANAIEDVS